MSDNEKDDFWNIDALIPHRKIQKASANTDAVDVTDKNPMPKPADSTPAAKIEPIPPRKANETVHPHEASLAQGPMKRSVYPTKPTVPPCRTYRPDSLLLHEVSLWNVPAKSFETGSFLRDAERFANIHGIKATHVPFFSYVPRYDQMTKSQLAWYLCLRDCIESGNFPETDYTYLLLLVYEVIGYGYRKDVKKGLLTLTNIWKNYRAEYPRLHIFLSEWICDYCLIHRLPPPDVTETERLELMEQCRLKEFYFSGSTDYLQALLNFASDYDYRKSRYCTVENRSLYDAVITPVLSVVINRFSTSGGLFSALSMTDCTVQRFAYMGAICPDSERYKIEVSYASFSRSHELRFLVTDVIKYTENRIRAYLGIRSRMTIYDLPNEVKSVIDGELATLLPKKAAVKKAKPVEIPEYEKLYDLPKTELNPLHAREIEEASWETTKSLVEAFEDADSAPIPEEPSPKIEETKPPETVAENAVSVDTSSVFAPYLPFLQAVRDGNSGKLSELSKQAKKPVEVLTDEVNDLFFDAYGDILLECDGDSPSIIADYTDKLDDILEGVV